MRFEARLMRWALVLAAGCAGTVEAPSSDSPAPAPGQDPARPPAETGRPACRPDVAIAPVRRLTREEYNNTVRDLIGDSSRPADAFTEDEKLLGFDVGVNTSPLLVDQYAEAARRLASRTMAALSRLAPCDPKAMGEEACARKIIGDLGRRIYRRPIATDEAGRLLAVFKAGLADHGYAGALEMVFEVMFQAPAFLYRFELGQAQHAGEAVAPLAPYEMASRLSYFLWGTMPDEALFRDAQEGRLDTAASVEAAARRMMASARFKQTVRSFHTQWLDLHGLDEAVKTGSRYAEFGSLRGSMKQESALFAERVVTEEGGRLETLLTAPWSMIDDKLARLYGAAAPAAGTFARVDLPAGQRAGLLTHASLLSLLASATDSHPVLRGLWVREHLLCQTPPPPPADMQIDPPDPNPRLSTRARYAAHTHNPACSGCHRFMDPIGLGFEHYDAIGRYRTMDGPGAVDASGEVFFTRDADGPFVGVPALGRRLAASDQVAGCMVRQWFTYALGRRDGEQDACAVGEIERVFRDARHDFRALVLALATSHSFRYRRNGEVGP